MAALGLETIELEKMQDVHRRETMGRDNLHFNLNTANIDAAHRLDKHWLQVAG